MINECDFLYKQKKIIIIMTNNYDYYGLLSPTNSTKMGSSTKK